MKILLSCILIALALSTGARGALITLGACADNTLYADPLGSLSNAQGPTFFAGQTGGNSTRRGFIRFDLAAIPDGAQIDSVTLSLYLAQALSFPTAVTLHRTLQAWGEGTSATGFRGGGGATSTTGDATWLHTFYSGSLWTNPGGDFATAASASTLVGAEGSTYTWGSTPLLIADAQGWIANRSSNFGWLLQGDETQGGTAKAFGTHEIASLAQRPALTVEYHIAAVPEPATACTGLALGLVVFGRALGRRRSRQPAA